MSNPIGPLETPEERHARLRALHRQRAQDAIATARRPLWEDPMPSIVGTLDPMPPPRQEGERYREVPVYIVGPHQDTGTGVKRSPVWVVNHGPCMVRILDPGIHLPPGKGHKIDPEWLGAVRAAAMGPAGATVMVHGPTGLLHTVALPGAVRVEDVTLAGTIEEEEEEEDPMADKPTDKSLLSNLEADATDAGWRLAGSQFVKMTRDPVVAMLSRHLGDDETLRAKVAAFLETDLGEALLASLLSLGLGMLPQQAGNIPQRLSRELRVQAMADAGDVIADLLMGPLRQVAAMYLQGSGEGRSEPAALPAETARVKAPVSVHEEAVDVVAPVGKKSTY